MADQKISQLTEKTTLVSDDVITILDSQDNLVNKKAKVGTVTTLTTYTATAPLDITNKTISIPQAATSVDGYLTSTDWDTFNGKANPQISGAYSTVNVIVPITSDNSNRVRKYTSPLSSLTLNGNPTSDTYEQEFRFTTGSTFTFTASGLVGKWIGGTPTFEPNKTYIIAIKNGLAAWGEVS